jgi:hypothetical protein
MSSSGSFSVGFVHLLLGAAIVGSLSGITKLPARSGSFDACRCIAILGVGLMLMCAFPPQANAALDAAGACEVSKLAAAGKYAACTLQAAAKATARQKMPFFDGCEQRFADRWRKIEAKGGNACPTQGDKDRIEAALADAAGDAQTITSSTADRVRCAAAQQKFLATYVKCVFTAYAKARKSGQLLDTGRCVGKLDKAWAATAKKFPSRCGLTSIEGVRDNLNVQAAEIARLLSGAPTATATPASTCGDGKNNLVSEECDGTDAKDCPGACRADCTCPNQAARIKLSVMVAQIGGRPGHEGLVPIDGDPIEGQPVYIRADVVGPYATVALRLVDSNDQPIQAVDRTHNDALTDADFVGQLTVPTQPFKVAASGTTRDGSTYDVVDGRLYTPQTIQLAWNPFFQSSLFPGGTTTLDFHLINYGPSDTFVLSAVADKPGLTASATTASTQLATGQSVAIAVRTTAANDVKPGTWVNVTLTVTSSTNANVRNSETGSIPVQ